MSELLDITQQPSQQVEQGNSFKNASVGDYIIKGVHGELYPCKPDIFEETYEEVE